MTIQISVTIWTIICFVLLVLILKNLLIMPVLKCMDERKARIDAAKRKKADFERMTEDNRKLIAEKQAEHEADKKKLIKERVEKIRSDQKKAVEAAKEVRLKRLDESRKNTEAEETEILSELGVHAKELAEMLADRIVKG